MKRNWPRPALLTLLLALLALSATGIRASQDNSALSQLTMTPSNTVASAVSPTAQPPAPSGTRAPSAEFTSAGAVFVQLGFHALIEAGGLRVGEIRPGSAAQRSGLRTGDLIVRVNNLPFNVQDVTGTILPLVTNLRPILTAMRDGQQVTILVSPTGGSPTPTLIRPPTIVPLPPQRTALGVAYDVVTPALANARKLSADYGALVTAVTPGSPADLSGIKVGDVITAVDGDKVDVKHTLLFRMMPYNVGDSVTLSVMRGTETVQIQVTLVLPGRASNSTG